MLETWRPIPSWEGIFEASDLGRIRSVAREVTYTNGQVRKYPGILRKLRPTADGHQQVWLKHAGRKPENRLVHVLVLTTFAGPRPSGLEVRHINGNPADNRLCNLRWGTHSENMSDSVAHGVHAQAAKTHCPQGHPYSGNNLYQPPNRNGRGCRLCSRKATQRYRKRKRLEASSSG